MSLGSFCFQLLKNIQKIHTSYQMGVCLIAVEKLIRYRGLGCEFIEAKSESMGKKDSIIVQK